MLGFAFLTLAIMVAFVAAGQVGAARAEEEDGRLDALLVRPVRRSAWLAGRAGVATARGGGRLVAGLCAWAGAATQSSGVGIVSLLEAGANVVPPGLCILGLGFLYSAPAPGRRGGHLRRPGLVPAHRGGGRSVQFRPLAARHVGVPPDGLGPGYDARLGQRRRARPRRWAATVLGAVALGRRDLAGQ